MIHAEFFFAYRIATGGFSRAVIDSYFPISFIVITFQVFMVMVNGLILI